MILALPAAIQLLIGPDIKKRMQRRSCKIYAAHVFDASRALSKSLVLGSGAKRPLIYSALLPNQFILDLIGRLAHLCCSEQRSNTQHTSCKACSSTCSATSMHTCHGRADGCHRALAVALC